MIKEDRHSKTALRLLRRFCPEQLYEEIEGDLIQRFKKDLNPSDRLPTGQAGSKRSDGYWRRRAKRRLLWNVIRFFRPGIVLRNKFSLIPKNNPMIGNYLKIGVRNLLKRKAYSFINIFGLALGLSVCLVIWRYVEFESSYDDFHKNGNQIYRTLFTDYKNGEKISSSPRFGYGLGPALLEDLPEVKTYVRTRELSGDKALIKFSDQSGNAHQFQEGEILFVDSTYLNVFTHKVLEGNAEQALDEPLSIVITKSVADRYFGKVNEVVGRTLSIITQVGIKNDFTITAIIDDVPENAHLQFDFLIPIHNLLQTEDYQQPRAEWDWVNFITYVMVHPDADVAAINRKTDALLTKYTGPNPPGTFIFTFQPLNEIHLAEQENNPFSSTYFFVLLSLFILAIAWINYINLSTARATERAREVGVKKAMGVLPGQLVKQFLVESFLINFLSIVVAIFFAIILLPVLNEMVGKDFSFDFTQSPIWMMLIGLLVTGTLSSGFYPAFVLSSFRTTDVIKGRLVKAGNSLSLRKGLIAFQFTASLLLIVGTLVIHKQINFMQNSEKGMNMNQMLIVEGPKEVEPTKMNEQLLSFKNDLLTNSHIQNVTSSGAIPGAGFSMITGMTKLGAQVSPNERETIYVVKADYDFVKTYGIELKTGRTFNPAIYSDRKAVLINEAALAPFGLGNAEQALNEKLIVDWTDTVTIVGVFKNAHWKSLHSAHVPMLLSPTQISGGSFSIQLNGNIKKSIASVEQLYKKHFPGNPFNYYFLDDFFNQQYKADQQFGKIFGIFSTLAVVIACFGLWGLASFAVSQRMKEISIRKVLGATVSNIVSLLVKQYFSLLIISTLIALPIASVAVSRWLSNYAFRIDLSIDLILLPVLILATIALTVVSFETMKAALSNPVNNLKNE